jgi:CAAX amino terminal protease family protein
MKDQNPNHLGIHYSHPWQYFLLVYLLSAPFWLLSLFIQHSALPDNLPLTDIGAALTPTIAAALLRYREGGMTAVRQLFLRILDYRRIKRAAYLWTAILLFPTLYLFTYLAIRQTGQSIPAHIPLQISLLGAFIMFFIAAIAEELGYAAYATESLQRYFTPIATALIIGVPWALWHLPSMIAIGQNAELIAWGLAGTIAVRIIYVWLYNGSGGSVFVLIMCHTVANTARTGFPGGRSAYENNNGAIPYGIIIITAILIIAFWHKAMCLAHKTH